MRVCIRSFWTHQQCWSSSKVWAMLPISNLQKCIFEPGLKPRSSSRVRLPRPRGPKIWLKISRKSSSYVSRKSLALSQISNRNRRFFFLPIFWHQSNDGRTVFVQSWNPNPWEAPGEPLLDNVHLFEQHLRSFFSPNTCNVGKCQRLQLCILAVLKRAHCIVLLSIEC